jgi:hypothetical protein
MAAMVPRPTIRKMRLCGELAYRPGMYHDPTWDTFAVRMSLWSTGGHGRPDQLRPLHRNRPTADEVDHIDKKIPGGFPRKGIMVH